MFRWLKTFINPDYGIIVSPQSCRVIKKRRAAILLNRIEKKYLNKLLKEQAKKVLGALGVKANKLLKEQAKKASVPSTR